MKMWAVTFWNVSSGKKEYREYPQIGSLEKYKGLCEMLMSRDWNVLKKEEGWIIDKI